MKMFFCAAFRRLCSMVLVALCLHRMATSAAQLQDDSGNSGWFVRLGGQVLTGVKAEIHNTRSASADSRVYDDGFVKPDISGGADTWNWGYTSPGQISGSQLTLHRTDNAPRVGDRPNLGDNSLYGGEAIVGFEFLRFRIGKKEARFGLEAGYGHTSAFSVQDSGSVTARAKQTTSTFDLGGVLPPIVNAIGSYAGTFQGPGPLIGLNPTASTVAEDDGVSRFDGNVQSDLHTLKFGPWIDLPMGGAFLLGLSMGYCAVYADTDFRFTDSVTYLNGAIPNSIVTGRVQRGEWSQGGYAELRLNYEFSRHVGVYVGGDAQYNGARTFGDAGREVKLKFGETYGGTVGLQYRF